MERESEGDGEWERGRLLGKSLKIKGEGEENSEGDGNFRKIQMTGEGE
jgi:hypothetical protein